LVVSLMRRRRFDFEDEDDLSVFEPKYLAQGKRVYKDGFGPTVKLYMTDSAPYGRRPVFDAGSHMPHEARLTDAVVRQRARVEDAYERRSNLMADAWTWNKPGVRAPVAVGDYPRDAWLRRVSTDWQKGAPRFDLDTTRSAGNTTLSPRPDDDDEDDGFDIATDPYARNYWSSVEAIRSGNPDNAARVEAAQRRMSLSQPGATAASVAAERRRFRPDDAAALADKEAAYEAYCRRIENDFRR
jgi:hypothetical protein